MAAKHILMGFCALYALARGIGTVLYYPSGAGQLQIAVLIISFIVSVIGLVAVVLWIAQQPGKGYYRAAAAVFVQRGCCRQYPHHPGQSGAAGHRPLGASHHRYGI